MKKLLSVFTALALILSLTACGQTPANSESEASAPVEVSEQPVADVPEESSSPEESQAPSGAEASEAPAEGGKTLIVYFSWSSSGNTEKMANAIKERTGGDILRIEPAVAYPTDYNECGDVAKVERDENARPEIANLPESLDEYDTIFIGYPIWWHTAPMIIGTFLESYDLSGKEVYPFAQSSSMDVEQFGNSMEFVRTSAAGANVHDGLFVTASDIDGINEYLTANGFAE